MIGFFYLYLLLMQDRYYLDIRVGCAAVIDSQDPKWDKSYPGLHHDTPGVVQYKHGSNSGGAWTVSESDIKELQDLCDKLNVYPNRDKKLNQLGI